MFIQIQWPYWTDFCELGFISNTIKDMSAGRPLIDDIRLLDIIVSS